MLGVPYVVAILARALRFGVAVMDVVVLTSAVILPFESVLSALIAVIVLTLELMRILMEDVLVALVLVVIIVFRLVVMGLM